jgi:hypothetical protein
MVNKIVRKESVCRVCGSRDHNIVLRLADTPLEDEYVQSGKLTIEQATYPLELSQCLNCSYVFLSDVVSPEVSYSNYVYKSSVTVGLDDHYIEYVKNLISEYSVPLNTLAIDIGSNDGLMLKAFKSCGLSPIGIEPAPSIAQYSNSQGFITFNSYFDSSTRHEIERDYGCASLITANYMFANVDDLKVFLDNIRGLLDSQGLFVVQTGYHPDQFKGMMFDYIYHEHFSYFTLDVLMKLFDLAGLQVINAYKVKPKGGSLRVVAQIKGGKYSASSNIERILSEERSLDSNFFKVLSSKINLSRDSLIALLSDIKASNKKVVGFGASHSTTTLLYHFNLATYLDYLVDDNIAKHGTFSPGEHIPVYSFEKIYEDKPDYILILAWQHAESIMSRHSNYLSEGGAWILPLPNLQVVQDK